MSLYRKRPPARRPRVARASAAASAGCGPARRTRRSGFTCGRPAACSSSWRTVIARVALRFSSRHVARRAIVEAQLAVVDQAHHRGSRSRAASSARRDRRSCPRSSAPRPARARACRRRAAKRDALAVADRDHAAGQPALRDRVRRSARRSRALTVLLGRDRRQRLPAARLGRGDRRAARARSGGAGGAGDAACAASARSAPGSERHPGAQPSETTSRRASATQARADTCRAA